MSGSVAPETPIRLPEEAEEVTADEIFRVLAHSRIRAILSILDQHSTPVPLSVLPRLVASKETGGETEDQIGKIRLSLYHHHLPTLEAVGLIEITADDEIDLVPTPSCWTDESFETFVKTDLLPADEMNRGLLALSNRRRRLILDVLEEHREITITDLADHLGEDVRGGSGSADVRPSLLTELLHVHVPKLVDLGIIESDGNRIRYTGNPLLDDWWFPQFTDSPSEEGEHSDS